MKLQYIITQGKAEHSDKINFKYISLQPRPRLIIGYQETPGNTTAIYSARWLSTTPAVNYGRFMAFVTNVLILEPMAWSIYCALFVKEDKTGTEES